MSGERSGLSDVFFSLSSDPDVIDLIEADLVIASVVEAVMSDGAFLLGVGGIGGKNEFAERDAERAGDS